MSVGRAIQDSILSRNFCFLTLWDFLGWYPFQLEPSSINDVDQHQSPTDLRRRARRSRFDDELA